jgi:hypothetical protein
MTTTMTARIAKVLVSLDLLALVSVEPSERPGYSYTINFVGLTPLQTQIRGPQLSDRLYNAGIKAEPQVSAGGSMTRIYSLAVCDQLEAWAA